MRLLTAFAGVLLAANAAIAVAVTPRLPHTKPQLQNERVTQFPPADYKPLVVQPDFGEDSFGTQGGQTVFAPINQTKVVTYYPEWLAADHPPNTLPWWGLDAVKLAFAIPDQNGHLDFNAAILRNLVGAAPGGKEVWLSVGGWGGSGAFSDLCTTKKGRQSLANELGQIRRDYGVAGFDIDWEYPGLPGSGNKYRPEDTANFLLLLQMIKDQIPDIKLSSATQVWPWVGPNGQPLTDVKEFAKVLDYVFMMAYDINGVSANPGANAPLRDGCGKAANPTANVESAIEQWAAAGMPRSHLTLGVPFYGYLSTSSATTLNPRQAVTIPGGPGQIDFRVAVESGALVKNSAGKYEAGPGWTRKWDGCSSTPYMYTGSTFFAYDDTDSIYAKAQTAARGGIGGVGSWTITGDTADSSLLTALRSGLGFSA